MYDLVIVGSGPSGLAAALAAKQRGLLYIALERGVVADTIYHYPRAKPLFSSSEEVELETDALPRDRKPTREQVLEHYLNIAQFGGDRLYGVEAASRVYFGKHASELNAIEAATIAGITQNPSRWDPLEHPLAAQKRRNVVLFTMYEQGMIDKAEYFQYRATPIAQTLDPHKPKLSCAAPMSLRSTPQPFSTAAARCFYAAIRARARRR